MLIFSFVLSLWLILFSLIGWTLGQSLIVWAILVIWAAIAGIHILDTYILRLINKTEDKSIREVKDYLNTRGEIKSRPLDKISLTLAAAITSILFICGFIVSGACFWLGFVIWVVCLDYKAYLTKELEKKYGKQTNGRN